MHLADAFIQSDLHCIQAIHFFSMCVPWESNPQPFALLTQCSTTEPQEHVFVFDYISRFTAKLQCPLKCTQAVPTGFVRLDKHFVVCHPNLTVCIFSDPSFQY